MSPRLPSDWTYGEDLALLSEADLVQVLDGLAAPGEASREVLRERLEPGHEVVLRCGVFRDALEQPKYL